MKNERKHGRSARQGNKPSPYAKYDKRPYPYVWQGARLANGERKVRANDRKGNRYA